MTSTLLSLGHGYSARALARRLLPQGWTVLGTTRDPEKADALRAEGVAPIAWDRAAVAEALGRATHLLVSAGPDADGDPSLRLCRDAIAARAHALDWAGYLSTTGVYGDHGGDWVDEDTPLTPGTRRGQWRLQAETDWRAVPGLPLHIFRLAGIYGPGRGPFEKVRNGTARRIVKPGQVFSRIHVEDIAQVLEASIRRPAPGCAYNLCDDDPAPPQDVLLHAAELLGVAPPPEIGFDAAEMSPMARSFYAENKRVSNRRIKEELGVQLRYPDYRAGLRALLDEEQG
ncbi:SDR family oxidoreductase [Salipiger thiooxidans]|jgi:nucleoside-diphosphate-sugar epimerase|uniref:SDR family oxidoreductase n=1 Tax=Salipiger thiooxidans TaxID=282683 RepID=UPI001CD4F475|nr:SDR family oxidoreductase [Salipiger thiooxidans]MCA0846690.1 SDR family oxidoreductase [Salipiger thiooxidans]